MVSLVRRLLPRRDQSPRLVVQLDPELTARVLRYHAEAGLLGKPQESVRELIRAALDYPEVTDSILRSARQRAYTAVRRDLEELVGAQLAELGVEWARRQRAGEVTDGRSGERLGE